MQREASEGKIRGGVMDNLSVQLSAQTNRKIEKKVACARSLRKWVGEAGKWEGEAEGGQVEVDRKRKTVTKFSLRRNFKGVG
jgi:hypothetical protein